MWAHEYTTPHGLVYRHIGSLQYVEHHLMSDPITPVVVAENANGLYYGWIRNGSDSPEMIWPSKNLFDMCFPYGPQIEKGEGRQVRLNVVRDIKA